MDYSLSASRTFINLENIFLETTFFKMSPDCESTLANKARTEAGNNPTRNQA
jgi:hypothetical protein